MKKVFFGILAVAFLASCGPKGNGPEKVASEYLNALKNKEWDKAKALGNEDTKAKVDGIKGFGGDAGITEVKDVKCTVTDNTATCTFCCMKEGDGKVNMVKEGDKWIVNDKKEGANMDMGTDTMTTTPPVEGDSLSGAMDNAAGTTTTEGAAH